MKTAFRAIINICIVVIVLEACARLADKHAYDAPFFGSYTLDRLYEMDSGQMRGKANARYRNWQLNSLGFRGPDLHDGTVRILCIGASETFGMLETPGREYPRQLEEILNSTEAHGKIEVVNFSYFGLKLTTAAALLPEVIREVRPTIAIIYPTYGGYVSRQSDTPLTEELAHEKQVFRVADHAFDMLKAHAPVWLMTKIRRMQIDRYVDGRDVIHRMPTNRSEFLATDLAQLTGTLRQGGVVPVLLTHANRFSGETDTGDWQSYLTGWRKFYPLYSEEALLDMETSLNDAVREFARRNQISLVDAARMMPGGSAYFTDHVHFTDEGARKMAELVAREVAPLLRAPGQSALLSSGDGLE